jgi:hypothetical protein
MRWMSGAALVVALGTGSGGALAAGGVPSAGQLLQQFAPGAPASDGSVRLDAWIEGRADGQRLVIVVEPEGETRLVADPGITVTPEPQAGVEWQIALPARVVDAARDYLDAPTHVTLPFAAEHEQPLRVLVEYAWCVLDFQCFFGEEMLSVATRID